MNFDSPSNLVKNIQEQFFGGSPDSPSFISKNMIKRAQLKAKMPLATKNLNTLFNEKETNKYASPASTLAVDVSEDFLIEEELNVAAPTSKKVLNSTQQELSRLAGLAMEEGVDQSPLLTKRDTTVSKSQQTRSRSPGDRSSRTTSNSSISSIYSLTSISSMESNATSISTHTLNTTITSKPSVTSISTSKPLRKTKTTILGDSVLHSYSSSTLNFNNEFLNTNFESDDSDENGDILDKLCAESPTVSRTLTLDDEDGDEDEHLEGLNKREIGSPIQKKPVRSKVRRIHSMFYSKKEITDTTNMFGNLMNVSPNVKDNDNDDSNLSNSLLKKSKIETFNVKNDSIPRIHVETLCKILDGKYKDFFEEVTIIDCRFQYEYKGGHINGAVNVSSQKELEEKFLHKKPLLKSNSTTNFTGKKNNLIVFHCEFSSYRGPLMASHLRTCDRNVNQNNYPHLDYPDILILEGGYKTFFDSQSHRCFPQKYVEMNDHKHKNACEKELTRFRRDLKKASSFNSLSFAASRSSTASITALSSSTSSSQRHHRRTLTSGTANFAKRSSLKGQLLDFKRSTVDINESDDETKPPESLNFGFKFPLPVNGLQPQQVIKKKLSKSLTYYK